MNNNIFEKEGLRATVNALTDTNRADDYRKAFRKMYDLGYRHGHEIAEKEIQLKALEEKLKNMEANL